MRLRQISVIVLLLFVSGAAYGEMFANPGSQVGYKNLYVGLEYSTVTQVYDIDTSDLDLSSERAFLKVTTGLSDWFDIYFRAGGATLDMDYKKNNYIYKTSTGSTRWGNASKNFESDYVPAFGAGARMRIMNFENSRTRVFVQGGGLMFKADDNITWDLDDGSMMTKNREMKFVDINVGAGLVKRLEYADLTIGAGFSEIWWEINDENLQKIGTATVRNQVPARDSFETKSPAYGFIGLDFILPREYRISLMANVKNADEAEFSVSLSQGLQRD